MRSGKVKGENRSFLVRHKEHIKAAKARERASKFYNSYPSRTTLELQPMLQCGDFEDLTQYCALCLSRTQNIEALLQTDGAGIFVWSKEMLEQIGAVNFSNAKNLQAKQLHMWQGIYASWSMTWHCRQVTMCYSRLVSKRLWGPSAESSQNKSK